MKTIKYLFALLFAAISTHAISQIKVISNGSVGINNTSPSYKLDVTGSTRLNGYVGINGVPAVGYPLSVTSAYSQIIMIDPSSSSNGSILGTSTGKLNFWYPTTGHFTVYAQHFITASDSTIKKDIKTLPKGALNKVLSLRPVNFKYKVDLDSLDKDKEKIGLIAQEVETVVPEAVSFNELGKIKMIDYDMLIPVLIKAMQEQEATIESLEKELKSLKDGSTGKSNSKGDLNNMPDSDINTATLEQNTPNPFSQNTEIRYFIPKESQSALLNVYNMNGMQIKSYKISERENGEITIHGSELQAGMYLYTLIVDGKEIDTKRMILTQ